MNPAPLRYVLTRPCLSEGSLTVANYLRAIFPAELSGQTLHLTDEQGRSYPAQLHVSGRHLSGLGALYHDHNLNVNDVLLLKRSGEHAYQVTCVVKPYTDNKHAPSAGAAAAAPARRVVVNATPHVREIRVERADLQAPPSLAPVASAEEVQQLKTAVAEGSAHVTARRSAEGGAAASETKASEMPLSEPRSRDLAKTGAAQAPAAQPQAATSVALSKEGARRGVASVSAAAISAATAPGPAAPLTLTPLATVGEQLSELAALTGYRLEFLGGHESGPVRLRADLGQHGYDVTLALSEAEMQHPAFKQSTYHALLTWEVDAASGAPRLTREALGALLEHARLAPLTPIDLRGYWNTASFDLDSVASLAELVSAHLAQRGTFSYVLGMLAQQSAHSLVDPARLAERLGSGVNKAELHAILETLSQAPFMALLPLPGGYYYLRADVPALLGELSEYAQGVARRLQAPTRAARA